MLSEKQQEYFNKLSEKRQNSIRIYKEDGLIDLVINLIVDTYRDSAHFVYELLQNADDAEATSVWFILNREGLFFSHNGSINFSVSNPDTEKESTSQRGHINAITNFFSTKSTEAKNKENKIGKFGIGFKSVFQYTSTPQVYNPPFLFEIQEYMIPIQIDIGYQQWLDDKNVVLDEDETTAFYLPFNSNEVPPERAYEEIRKKIEELTNPLLFLNHLKKIQWQTDTKEGCFTKIVEDITDDIISNDSCIVERIELGEQSFYVFSREEFGHRYSIAYPLDKDKKVDSSDKYNLYTKYAYCFFPTRQETKVKLLIHAPFILTPNREGIKENKEENEILVKGIAKLTADSLTVCKELNLVNDKFFNVLPINTSDFSSISEFKPIYDQVLKTLKVEELLPVNNGENHISANNAYLAESNPTEELLAYDNWQPLRDLVNNQSACWVFSSVTDSNQKEVWEFVKNNLVVEVIDPESLARKLNKNFIQRQSDNWLVQLYGFLDDRKGTHRIVKSKPIIIESSNREAIGVLNEKGKLQVYLSSQIPHLFRTVKKCFEQEEKSLSFFKSIGITQPDIHHEMEAFTEHRKRENDWDLISDFEKFLDYFINKCPESKKDGFIKSIKSLSFLKSYLSDIPELANQLYQPTEALKLYFGCEDEDPKKHCSIQFLDTNYYKKIYEKYSEEDIINFLIILDILDTPRIIPSYSVEESEIKIHREKVGLKNKCNKRSEKIKNYDLDGLSDLLALCEAKENIKIRSIQLFKFLTNVQEYSYSAEYRRNDEIKLRFESNFLSSLKKTAWLYDKNNIACKPSAITIEDLAPEYDLSNAYTLIKKLEFKTDDTGSSFERTLRQAFSDLTDKQIFDFIKEGRERDQKKKNSLDPLPPRLDDEEEITVTSVVKRVSEGAKEKLERRKSATGDSSILSTKPTFSTDIDLNTSSDDENNDNVKQSVKVQIEEGESDDDVPLSVDLQKEINRIEESAEEVIAQLTRKKQLEEIIEYTNKYTFAWFKALLELEYNCATQDQVKKNPIRVIFKKVEFETGTNNTIILSDTSTFIPNRIEDIGDLQLVLNLKNNVSKSVLVEVLSPQKRILKAKLKDIATLDEINLVDVESAVIEVKNADFILETLKSAFNRLPFADDDNLQTNLSENIEFVFGPPGTGKTTYLARNKISSEVNKNKVKILVLTPTNKAADVLTKKLMEECPSHLDWLIRYGITQDNEISNSSIFKTKEIPRSSFTELVLVTTIARFSYESFKINNPNGDNWSFGLKDFDWDYIIFDEASMISLASIVYTIYYVNQRKPDCKFIVGGDPFQLSPVIHVAHDGWKDGNIYTLVGLDQEDSFTNPQTVPHEYNVINLETQYRSIPQLGTLFSEFRYNGRLIHHKNDSDINEVEIANLPLNPITIIDFKVSKFESIYKPRKVKGSNYQIYSAIFTVEFIKYIIENITISSDDLYKIGVICPYRIQSNIVDKLLAKLININLKKIEIISGTVHSFQGDECNMIINLLNPPLYVSDSKEIFLNKKNLLNVSISRAKDYLILLLPVDASQNIQTDKLTHIKEIRDLTKSESISAADIEKIILGNTNAIEDFSFPTTHQDVNIYIEPEKKYEIRYDDNAVDIQVKTA